MKFAKVLIALAIIAPQVASAQDAPAPAPVPTNFVFLAPILTAFVALPLLAGDNTPSTNGTN